MTPMDARHHHAVQVVFVETPAAGSPKSARTVKPGRYPTQRREPWRPASRPPSKAAATVELLRRIAGQDAMVRDFMRSAREEVRSHAER